MKKSILIWALLLTVTAGSTFANNNDNGVSDKVIKSFKKEFNSAQDVQWEQSRGFAKATFKLNDQIVCAYYSEEGDLLGLTRNIVSTQLPISLLADLKKDYNGYWITDLFEMAAQDTTNYYITIENSDYTIVLKSSGSEGWEVYRKEKKENY